MSRASLLLNGTEKEYGTTHYGSATNKGQRKLFQVIPTHQLLSILQYLCDEKFPTWLKQNFWNHSQPDETPKKIPEAILNLLLTNKKLFSSFLNLPDHITNHFFSTLYRFKKYNGAIGHLSLTAASSIGVFTPTTEINGFPKLLEQLRDPKFIDALPIDFLMMHKFKRRLYVAIAFLLMLTACLTGTGISMKKADQSMCQQYLFTGCPNSVTVNEIQNQHLSPYDYLKNVCSIEGICSQLLSFIIAADFNQTMTTASLTALCSSQFFCNICTTTVNNGKAVFRTDYDNKGPKLVLLVTLCSTFGLLSAYYVRSAIQSFFQRSSIPQFTGNSADAIVQLSDEDKKLIYQENAIEQPRENAVAIAIPSSQNIENGDADAQPLLAGGPRL